MTKILSKTLFTKRFDKCIVRADIEKDKVDEASDAIAYTSADGLNAYSL